jgi:hypothetical protein
VPRAARPNADETVDVLPDHTAQPAHAPRVEPRMSKGQRFVDSLAGLKSARSDTNRYPAKFHNISYATRGMRNSERVRPIVAPHIVRLPSATARLN